MHNLTRGTFARLPLTAAATALGLVLAITGLADTKSENKSRATPADAQSPRPSQDEKLQSEFLLDLTLEAQTPHNLGSASGGRLIVPVPEARLRDLISRAPSFRPEAIGSSSVPTDRAFSTSASCCRPMTDKRFTYRGAELLTRLRVKRSTPAFCRSSRRRRRNTNG
jgi:hypothetical protein